MTTDAPDTLKERVEALDRRLEAHKRQLKDRGEFSDVHDIVVADTRRRQAEIKRRIDVALKKGPLWDVLRFEFQLEFNGLAGTFLGWQERLDAEAILRMTRA